MNFNIARDGKETDIVIFVMGLTGAGKSTFINKALGQELMKVGVGVASCTTYPFPVVIDPIPGFPNLKGRRLVLVDTPGFDDTHHDDGQILAPIAEHLADYYRKNMFPGGIIYLHDISIRQITAAARNNLEMLSRLCGNTALRKVLLVNTSWDPAHEARETALKNGDWKALIEGGARVERFLGNKKSAWDVINTLLQSVDARTYFQIQEELVDVPLSIEKTEAGKYLEKIRKKRKSTAPKLCTVQ